MSTISIFRAEGRKIKGSVALYLVPLTVVLLLGVVMLAHSLDVHRLAVMGQNPWPRYFKTAITSYTMVLASPLCVLLCAAVLYIEQRADAWKQLYTLPVSRQRILVTKVGLLLILMASGILFYCLGLWASGHLLGVLFPEYEFAFHQPEAGELLHTGALVFVASLGLIGLQFLLGLLFRSIIVSLGIGFFGIIAGFILSTTEAGFTSWFPYAYPLIAHDSGATNAIHREAIWGSWPPAIIGSVVWFIGCLLFVFWWEGRREVD
ncbi:MAG: ABC transporter permease [Lewinella sp.]